MAEASQAQDFFSFSFGYIIIFKPVGMAFNCPCCPETPLRYVTHEAQNQQCMAAYFFFGGGGSRGEALLGGACLRETFTQLVESSPDPKKIGHPLASLLGELDDRYRQKDGHVIIKGLWNL